MLTLVDFWYKMNILTVRVRGWIRQNRCFMKLTSIILIVFLVALLSIGLVGCLPYRTPEPEVATFKLMSFNMRINVIEANGKRVPYDTVKERAPMLLKHIADGDPDVICAQEWTTVHTTYLEEELGKTYEIIFYDRGDLYEGCAILFKKDRFELVEEERFWLSETPDEPSYGWDAQYPRIYISTVLRDKKNNKTFRVGTTHIEANENVAKGQQRKMVVDYTRDSKEPAILCGDFNFDATHSLYLYCINTLNDCRTLDPNATTTASYNGYNFDGKALDNDGNVKDGYGYPIDQIFVKRNTFTVHSYDVLNYQIDGMFSSDHYPVLVELSLNN